MRVPHLTVIADRDHLIPPEVAAPLADLIGSRTSDVLRSDAGHIGLVLGRSAAKVTVPAIIDFLRRMSDSIDEGRGERVRGQQGADAAVLP